MDIVRMEKSSNNFYAAIRVYSLIAMIYISIFVPQYNIGNNTLEWFLVFDLFVIIDIFNNIIRTKKYSGNNIIKFMSIFIFYNILLLLFSILVNRNNYIIGIFHLGRVIGLLIFYPWINLTFNSNDLLKFIKNFIISIYIFAIYAIIDFMLIHKFAIITYYGYFTPRLDFGNIRTNLLGYMLVFFIIFIQTYEKKNINKILFSLILFFLILQTASKMAVLALIIYFLLKFMKIGTKKKSSNLIIIFCLLSMLVIIIILYGEKILENNIFYRIKAISDQLLSGQSIMNTDEAERIKIQLTFLNDNSWNPIFGYFYYYFFTIYLGTCHNYFIELLYDTGIIGLTIFIKLIYEFYKKSENKRIYILPIIIAYNLTENYFFYFVPLILFYVMVDYNSLDNKIDTMTYN